MSQIDNIIAKSKFKSPLAIKALLKLKKNMHEIRDKDKSDKLVFSLTGVTEFNKAYVLSSSPIVISEKVALTSTRFITDDQAEINYASAVRLLDITKQAKKQNKPVVNIDSYIDCLGGVIKTNEHLYNNTWMAEDRSKKEAAYVLSIFVQRCANKQKEFTTEGLFDYLDNYVRCKGYPGKHINVFSENHDIIINNACNEVIVLSDHKIVFTDADTNKKFQEMLRKEELESNNSSEKTVGCAP